MGQKGRKYPFEIMNKATGFLAHSSMCPHPVPKLASNSFPSTPSTSNSLLPHPSMSPAHLMIGGFLLPDSKGKNPAWWSGLTFLTITDQIVMWGLLYHSRTAAWSRDWLPGYSRRSGRRLHRVGKANATDVGTNISFWEAHDRWLVWLSCFGLSG